MVTQPTLTFFWSFFQDSRIVIEKFKSGFSAPGDIPFEDLSSADNASVSFTFLSNFNFTIYSDSE